MKKCEAFFFGCCLTADSNALLKFEMNSAIWVHSCKAIKTEKTWIAEYAAHHTHTHTHAGENIRHAWNACYHIEYIVCCNLIETTNIEGWNIICVCVRDLRYAYVSNSMKFKIAQKQNSSERTSCKIKHSKNIYTLFIVSHRSKSEHIARINDRWNIMAVIAWVQCK